MMLNKTLPALIISATLVGCGDDDSNNGNTTTYQLTFTTNWSAAQFNTNYPSNRHFSPLIGLTHNMEGRIFKLGEMASSGIISVAETGATRTLQSEINSIQNLGFSHSSINGQGVPAGVNSTTLTFDVSEDHPYISVVTMLAPSPDWFTGVDSLSLMKDGEWVETLTVDLNTYDAGSDVGKVFTSGNQPINPNEVITMLTSERADTDFSNGVHFSTGISIGTFEIKKLD